LAFASGNSDLSTQACRKLKTDPLGARVKGRLLSFEGCCGLGTDRDFSGAQGAAW
jgi:hypothetical protein